MLRSTWGIQEASNTRPSKKEIKCFIPVRYCSHPNSSVDLNVQSTVDKVNISDLSWPVRTAESIK